MRREWMQNLDQRLIFVWYVWFGIYMLTGIAALHRGSTSLLAQTGELTDSMFLRLTFLNIPLQLALAAAAVFCGARRSDLARKWSLALALCAVTLAVGHLALTAILGS